MSQALRVILIIGAVLALLCVFGAGAAILLARAVPHTNPQTAEPGSPYFSAPSQEELKAMRSDKAN